MRYGRQRLTIQAQGPSQASRTIVAHTPGIAFRCRVQASFITKGPDTFQRKAIESFGLLNSVVDGEPVLPVLVEVVGIQGWYCFVKHIAQLLGEQEDPNRASHHQGRTDPSPVRPQFYRIGTLLHRRPELPSILLAEGVPSTPREASRRITRSTRSAQLSRSSLLSIQISPWSRNSTPRPRTWIALPGKACSERRRKPLPGREMHTPPDLSPRHVGGRRQGRSPWQDCQIRASETTSSWPTTPPTGKAGTYTKSRTVFARVSRTRVIVASPARIRRDAQVADNSGPLIPSASTQSVSKLSCGIFLLNASRPLVLVNRISLIRTGPAVHKPTLKDSVALLVPYVTWKSSFPGRACGASTNCGA